MATSIRQRIGAMLINAGKIEASQLEESLRIQKEKEGYLGQVIVDRGYVEENELYSFLSHQLKVPYLRLGYFATDKSLIIVWVLKPDLLTLSDELCAERKYSFKKEESISTNSEPVTALTVAFLSSPRIRESSPKISPDDIPPTTLLFISTLNEPEIIKKAELPFSP